MPLIRYSIILKYAGFAASRDFVKNRNNGLMRSRLSDRHIFIMEFIRVHREIMVVGCSLTSLFLVM